VKVLLDTHIVLWWFSDGGDLSRRQRRVLDGASSDAPLLVSDISLWEIAQLHQRERIRLDMPLREWLERATAAPLVLRCSITPAVAAETGALPYGFPRDPADRIIAATARVHGASLMTHDSSIIDSGALETL
jgi:PIN domain nuclease of toxin-antitoxin system